VIHQGDIEQNVLYYHVWIRVEREKDQGLRSEGVVKMTNATRDFCHEAVVSGNAGRRQMRV